jgi:hypothetical protein
VEGKERREKEGKEKKKEIDRGRKEPDLGNRREAKGQQWDEIKEPKKNSCFYLVWISYRMVEARSAP